MTETTRPTLTLIDGSSYIFRAYHAIRTELATSKGLPTRAVFGFTRMLLKSLREASPTHVAVVWDRDGKTLRQAIEPQYKAQRPAAPDDLKQQFPWIRKVVDEVLVLGVPDGAPDDAPARVVARGTHAELLGLPAYRWALDQEAPAHR